MSRRYIPPSFATTSDALISYRQYADFSNILQYHQTQPTQIFLGQSRNIAIYIDGACAGNGTSYARAGMGVYFGPDSKYNMSMPLLNGPQTNQRAEISAAILTLEMVILLLEERFLFTDNVVLISGSSYVVHSMTDWVIRWKKNEWKNCRGCEVANRDDYERLDELMDYLGCRYGVETKFWLVSREYTQEADSLARDAVEEVW